jgi:putative membrane protein
MSDAGALMRTLLSGWRFDPIVVTAGAVALAVYFMGTHRYRERRRRNWPATRSWWFAVGIASALLAIESPLDAAGDTRFAPHMVQHLVLTDVAAPCMLLGAPLLLLLSVARNDVARGVVAFLKGPIGRVLAFPVFTWVLFIVTLWIVHYTGFFEAALDWESVHILEHAVYLTTALLFWLPVIAIGPTPWSDGPLAYPLRMLYLLVAMPAEGMLGFTLNGARHVLYPHYAAAGIGDQQAAGEIMWIGSTLCMFVAFMIVGYRWAEHEQRLGERANDRA